MFDTGEIRQLGKELATLVPGDIADDDLMELAVGLERLASDLNLARAHVLAQLDADGTCFDRHGLNPPGWVAREANTSPPAARHAMKVGHALRTALGEVDD